MIVFLHVEEYERSYWTDCVNDKTFLANDNHVLSANVRVNMIL